jgi:hypothetical protein
MEAAGFDSFQDPYADPHYRSYGKRTVSMLYDDEAEAAAKDLCTKIFVGGLNSITSNGKFTS